MQTQTDPVSVMVTFLAAYLSPAVSAALGPYAVIFLASAAGASWSLGRQEPMTNLRGSLFFARVVITACVLTSSIAAGLHQMYDSVTAEWSFVPIAFVIGLIGDDWGKVRTSIVDFVTRWLSRGTT